MSKPPRARQPTTTEPTADQAVLEWRRPERSIIKERAQLAASIYLADCDEKRRSARLTALKIALGLAALVGWAVLWRVL